MKNYTIQSISFKATVCVTLLHVSDYRIFWDTALKDGSLQINSLALNVNCFDFRNIYQNDVDALSKMV